MILFEAQSTSVSEEPFPKYVGLRERVLQRCGESSSSLVDGKGSCQCSGVVRVAAVWLMGVVWTVWQCVSSLQGEQCG